MAAASDQRGLNRVPQAGDSGEFSNEFLLDRYEDLCGSADRHALDGWRSLREDGQKRRFELTPEILDRFANYRFGGIGFEVEIDYLGAPVSLTGEIPELAITTGIHGRRYLATVREFFGPATATALGSLQATNDEWLRLIQVDNVVGGLCVTMDILGQSTRVSTHTIRVALRALQLRARMGGIPQSVLEIGGGHGRFVRDVLKLSADSRITYCDLPFNLLLAARYLSRVFPGDVALIWSDIDPVVPDARITLVSPWRLSELGYHIDVCCNFLSFQHMAEDNLDYYGNALDRLGVPAIYHQNRKTALRETEIDLDAYPFRHRFSQAYRAVQSTSSIWRRSPDGSSVEIGRREIIEELLTRSL